MSDNSIETLRTVRMRLEVAHRLVEMATHSSIRAALKKIDEALGDIDSNPASSHAKFVGWAIAEQCGGDAVRLGHTTMHVMGEWQPGRCALYATSPQQKTVEATDA